MNDRLARLGRALGYEFRDGALLERALTHRSAGADNYERLEFLGDALINFAVAETVFRTCPGASEGDLSRLRSSLVCEESLAALAEGLQLGDALVLGPGELKSGAFRRQSILADTLEALVGAVYLDGGFEPARQCCERLFAPAMSRLPDPATLKDAKTRLQERLQGLGRPLPRYDLVSTEGPPHRQSFNVTCRLADGGTTTPGTGASRRTAEQDAADKMLGLLESGHA